MKGNRRQGEEEEAEAGLVRGEGKKAGLLIGSFRMHWIPVILRSSVKGRKLLTRWLDGHIESAMEIVSGPFKKKKNQMENPMFPSGSSALYFRNKYIYKLHVNTVLH